MTPGITVVIPCHPARIRNGMLGRAMMSVYAQTLPAAGVSIAIDLDGRGAPHTRQRALNGANTDWVAFLDSDDYFMVHHLQMLMQAQQETDADYVYSWFQTDPPGHDPFPSTHFTEPWDNSNPRQTTITTLVRTGLARAVGFWESKDEDEFPDGLRVGEDWVFTLGCLEQGAKIHHVAERSWVWSHHGKNSSGRPGHGDA